VKWFLIKLSNINDTVPRFFENRSRPKPSNHDFKCYGCGNQVILFVFGNVYGWRNSVRIFRHLPLMMKPYSHETIYAANGYAEPHGAVGYLGLKR
jgi:hypothetical protein